MTEVTTLPDNPILFSTENWKLFLSEHGLCHCLRLGTAGGNFWGKWPAFTIKDAALNEDIWTPNIDNTATYRKFSTYSKTLDYYFEKGFDSENLSVGIPGIFSVSVDHSSSHSNTSEHIGENYYMTCKMKVPKGTVNLHRNSIVLEDEFVQAVRRALQEERQIDRATKLVQILDTYGHYVILSAEFGGVLYSTESMEVTSDFNASTFEESVGVSFNANLSAIDVPLEVGGGIKTGNAQAQKYEQVSKKMNITMNCIGGAAEYLNSYPDWSGSLEKNSAWRFIGIPENTADTMAPIINFLDDADCAAVANALAVYGESDYIKKGQELADAGI